MYNIKRPLPFILAATNTGTMIVNHLDYNTINNQSYGVGHNYLEQASFDEDEVQTCLSLLRLRKEYFGAGVMALDAGANIGAHSIAWGIEMSHWGEVIAIEAQERIYYALAGNVAINNCFNIKAIHAAVGNPPSPTSKNKPASLEIPHVDYTKHASFGSLELQANENTEFIGQNIDYNKTYSVPLISVDSLNLARLDLLKIDVEGMEVEVLKGASKSLKKHKSILLIETIKSNLQELQTLLDSISKKAYISFPMGLGILAVHKDDPCLKHINQA